MLLKNYMFETRHPDPIVNCHNFLGAFDEKIYDFYSCIEIPIVPKFRKMLLILTYFEIQTHFSRLPLSWTV